MLQVTDQRTQKAWTKALERAIAEALDVLIEPVSGEAFVESASRPGVLYQVSATSCTCPAGQRGNLCKHRACYLAQVGELPLPAAPELADCSACCGCGEVWSPSGGWKCETCKGTGRVPAPPMPRVFPVAVPAVAA